MTGQMEMKMGSSLRNSSVYTVLAEKRNAQPRRFRI